MFTLNERQILIELRFSTMAEIKDTFITTEVLLYFGIKRMIDFR